MTTVSSIGSVLLVLLFGAGLLTLMPSVHATCLGKGKIPIAVEEIDFTVAFAVVPADQQHQDYVAVVKDIAREFDLPLRSDSSIETSTLPDKYLYHNGRLINLEDGVDAVIFVSSYIPYICDYATPFVFASIDLIAGTVKEGEEVEGRTDLFSEQDPKKVRSVLMDKIPEALPQEDFMMVTLVDPPPTSNRHRNLTDYTTVIVGMGDKVYRIFSGARGTQAIIWGSDGKVSRLYVGPERHNVRSQIKGTYSVGDRNEEVRWAQRLLNKGLNKEDCEVADSGPGSPGNESDYFGEKTRDALACFQKKHGVWVGALGDLTPHTYASLFDTYWSWRW